MDDRRRRTPLPILAAALLAMLVLGAPVAQAANCPGANVQPANASAASASAATLCLLNGERAARGLAPLTSQPLLAQESTRYSQEMVALRFFAHTSPAGAALAARLEPYTAGARSFHVGENLAWGEGERATPARIVDAWMHSDGHRANVLGDYTEVGIGIADGSPIGSPPQRSATYTAAFGRRAFAAAADSHAMTATVGRAGRAVSAKTRKRIAAQCRRNVRRVRSTSARRAKYASCVSKRLRAARRA